MRTLTHSEAKQPARGHAASEGHGMGVGAAPRGSTLVHTQGHSQRDLRGAPQCPRPQDGQEYLIWAPGLPRHPRGGHQPAHNTRHRRGFLDSEQGPHPTPGSTPKHSRSHNPSVARPPAEQGVREGSAHQGHDDHQPSPSSTAANQSAKGPSGRRPGDTLAANTWTHLS